MCGRFTLRTPAHRLAEAFGVDALPNLAPRYNIAPTQDVVAIRHADDGRELTMLRWGLIPGWAKDPAIGARMINARAETVAEKPSFRAAFRQRRCLIAADGFYEWRTTAEAPKAPKQPYYIRLESDAPLAIAGLWERWHYDAWLEPRPASAEALQDLLRPYHGAEMTAFPIGRHVNNVRNDDPACIEALA